MRLQIFAVVYTRLMCGAAMSTGGLEARLRLKSESSGCSICEGPSEILSKILSKKLSTILSTLSVLTAVLLLLLLLLLLATTVVLGLTLLGLMLMIVLSFDGDLTVLGGFMEDFLEDSTLSYGQPGGSSWTG